MASGKTSFPTRRAAAERNRDKILAAARDAFTDHAAEISMAEVARRAGVGMATLYRNFPGRPELLEALYTDEVDALCEAAVADDAQPGEALIGWLRRLFAFIPNKRLIVSELLEHTDPAGPVIRGNRTRALDAARPLLTAAQDADEIRGDVTLEQIFDGIAAIAKIQGEAAYLAPLFATLLDGLRLPPGAELPR
ncbi:TetR/AcrR family transcriptional regulator [Streptomyces sp. SID10853]|uniref:TetR/AcrR family transcriptional regulator n=1 Tax=Streptomyces sp. SID10853 TaxID=2706028 RepID=UPI0013C0CFC7|nr:TetR/AcrR family transcriptional regulator [Streptomyces sp. SID10853]NDZ82360.1 TetR/AcrR family transcriptional regulator [Streptomyces sp. SID10853]